jgi:hypothetical protein
MYYSTILKFCLTRFIEPGRTPYLMPKQPTMTEVLRAALNDAVNGGSSFREVERETGIVRQSLMPFARGEQTLLLTKADELAAYFVLELRLATRRKGQNR